MTSPLKGPNEGEADTHTEIADELVEALGHIERVDYDALVHENLRELLDARETVEDLCLKHRDMQSRHSADARTDESVVDLAEVHGERDPDGDRCDGAETETEDTTNGGLGDT